jgi:hypothetical protein
MLTRLGSVALLLAVPTFLTIACSSEPAATNDGADGGGLTPSDPNAPDAVQTPAPTDEGCGGSANPPCADGKKCLVGKDCTSQYCEGGVCKPKPSSGPSYSDGIKNGPETDVDCGGPPETPGFKACGTGKACAVATDCESQVCDAATKKCNAPSYTDGIKNGDESDVDCGGNPANPGWIGCATGKTCAAHRDCASDGCGYDKKCALYRSCTAHYGGDTCGSGEVGEAGAKHESCCTTLPVPTAGNVNLEKYNITAGRMRTFLDRVNNDVQAWLNAPGNKPAWWRDAWTQWLPTGLNTPIRNVNGTNRNLGVYGQLGPNFVYDQAGVFGCWSGNDGSQSGAPTYWIPLNERQAQNPLDAGSKYAQTLLDQKSLNCVNYLMIAAFCAWDGGRPPTIQELDAAWGPSTYPWGASPVPAGYANGYPTPENPANYSPLGGDTDVANYRKNYPKTGAQYNYVDFDLASYIAPPGRFPRGAGPFGHMDLAGNVFNATMTLSGANLDDPQTALSRWSRSGSWETAHSIPYGVHNSPLLRKYWAQGGRCVKP